MSKVRKLFVASLLLVVVGIFAARGQEEGSFDRIFYNGYDNDGYFVTIPAYTGNYLGMIIGAPPAALAAGGFHLFNAQPYYTREAAFYTLQGFSTSLGFILGLPFKLVKVVLWDSPKYVLEGMWDYGDKPLPVPDNTVAKPVKPEKSQK